MAFDDATEALVALGPVALPSLVAARTEASSDDHKSRLEAVLARLGGKEPVILAFLLEGLARGDSAAPANLARFGDPRALEDLSAALDRAELVEREDSPLLVGHHVVELVGAIRKLGGALSEAQQRRLGSTLDQRRSIAEGLLLDAAEVRRKKTGRNEPCWCGSGKKYKKCHS
ncbi:MAG: SEC-C domain-containing protein [Deltaproteobacteria bacterium]|nr:SEC-C domain-containing protein [Deltaproteobacteria bacterium]